VAPPDEWLALAEMRERHPARWMLWESNPDRENVRRLEELGIQSTVFDPCGNRQADGDFLGVMTRNVENMERVFSPQISRT